MIPSIQSKLPQVGTTIFTVMSGLAAEHKAVNLGQGFPDYPMNEELTGLVDKAMRDGFNQYAPMQGYIPLREALAEKVKKLYKADIDPGSDITITPGGTYAIYTALTTVLAPGDEVIVFEPAYDSYIPNIEINGAIAIRLPLRYPDYSIDWQLVRESVTARTRVIMINSPHNPTGAVLHEQDLQELRAIVKDTRILILSDEVYEHLIFDGVQHESVLKYPDLMERAFVCFSFGKVYHCTGWKLGYCISNPALMAEFRKVHQYNCFCCHSPSQVALAEYIRNEDSYLGLGSFLQEKRDYFIRSMQGTSFDLLPSYGSYFICAKYDRISRENDTAFAKRLTIENKVATIPVSAFYKDGNDNHVIRFCFAKKKETIDAAIEKLLRL